MLILVILLFVGCSMDLGFGADWLVVSLYVLGFVSFCGFVGWFDLCFI